MPNSCGDMCLGPEGESGWHITASATNYNSFIHCPLVGYLKCVLRMNRKRRRECFPGQWDIENKDLETWKKERENRKNYIQLLIVEAEGYNWTVKKGE